MSTVIRTLKTDLQGRCFHTLGTDGVVRVFHFNTGEVIDAVGLSPVQIKEWQERRPFDQATEDQFRGVDDRTASEEDMFNPSQDIVPQRPERGFVERYYETFEERKREGFQKDPDVLACNTQRCIYTLDLR